METAHVVPVTKKYRFIGDAAGVGDLSLDRFGQEIELNEAAARNLLASGIPILPESLFETLGFTPEELAEFPSAIAQTQAPAEFQKKKTAALLALFEFRQFENL